MNLELNFIAFKTIARREITRSIRIWKQTFLPPIINAILYFFIFGNLIGARIGEMEGVSYIEFIIPGLIMMTIINSSFMSVAGGFFISKFQKSIEEILISPMNTFTLIAGHVISSVIISSIIGLIILIISAFFIPLNIFNFFIIILFVILTGTLFSLFGLLVGNFSRNFDDLSFIPTFVLTPLTFLGGVFYSISLLPNELARLSYFNPILYMVNGLRYGFLGISDVDILFAFTMVSFCIIILLLTNFYFISRGIGLKN